MTIAEMIGEQAVKELKKLEDAQGARTPKVYVIKAKPVADTEEGRGRGWRREQGYLK